MTWISAKEQLPYGEVIVARQIFPPPYSSYAYFFARISRKHFWKVDVYDKKERKTFTTRILDDDMWCTLEDYKKPEKKKIARNFKGWTKTSECVPSCSNYYLVFIPDGVHTCSKYRVVFFNKGMNQWEMEEYKNLNVEWWHDVDILSCRYISQENMNEEFNL